MTERWRRELKKLTPLEMPDDVRERMERGPGPIQLPPRRQRVTAGVVAFAVFAAAGAFAFQALRNRKAPVEAGGRQPSTMTVDLQASAPPAASLTFDGLTWQGLGGSACWEGTQGGCVDVMAATFTEKDVISIPTGTMLTVGGAPVISGRILSSPGWTAYPTEPQGPFVIVRDLGELAFSPVALDLKPGSYALSITGAWQKGTREFLFDLRVLPSSGAAPELGCPSAFQHPIGDSGPLAIGSTPQDVLDALSGSQAGDRIYSDPSFGNDIWLVDRSGVLITWFRTEPALLNVSPVPGRPALGLRVVYGWTCFDGNTTATIAAPIPTVSIPTVWPTLETPSP